VTVTDAVLHCRVLAEFESEPSLTGQEIGLAVQKGVATLSGYVDSYSQKGVAVRAAARVDGVKGIALDLRVRVPGPRVRSDTEVALAALDYLRSHCRWGSGQLTVRVEGGWVTLEGEVELFTQKAEAEEAVLQLAGVRGVTNGITVRPPELVNDITSKTEAALAKLTPAVPSGPA